MKDNIDNKQIGNRKFIIELRYAPIVSMLDKRGQITDAIVKSKCFATYHWEVNPGEVTIRDHAEKKESKNIVFVSYNRFSFISYKVDSIESFYSNFKKAYDSVNRNKLKEIIINKFKNEEAILLITFIEIYESLTMIINGCEINTIK